MSSGSANWCHVCSRTVRPSTVSGENVCPVCSGGFVEKVNSVATMQVLEAMSTVLQQIQPSIQAGVGEGGGLSTGGEEEAAIMHVLEAISAVLHQIVPSIQEGAGEGSDLLAEGEEQAAVMQVLEDMWGVFQQIELSDQAGGRGGLSTGGDEEAGPDGEAGGGGGEGGGGGGGAEGGRIRMPQVFQGQMQNFLGGGGNVEVLFDNGRGVPRRLPGNISDYFLGPGLDQLIQELTDDDSNSYGAPPASKTSIEAMPTIQIADVHLKNDFAQCAVCKDEFELGSRVRQMPCKHMYHPDCILPWLELHNSCPVCRYEMPTGDSDDSPTAPPMPSPTALDGGNSPGAFTLLGNLVGAAFTGGRHGTDSGRDTAGNTGSGAGAAPAPAAGQRPPSGTTGNSGGGGGRNVEVAPSSRASGGSPSAWPRTESPSTVGREDVICPVCSGAEDVICPTCSICPICSGREDVICPACSGEEVVICPVCSDGDDVICPICSGGYVDMDSLAGDRTPRGITAVPGSSSPSDVSGAESGGNVRMGAEPFDRGSGGEGGGAGVRQYPEPRQRDHHPGGPNLPILEVLEVMSAVLQARAVEERGLSARGEEGAAILQVLEAMKEVLHQIQPSNQGRTAAPEAGTTFTLEVFPDHIQVFLGGDVLVSIMTMIIIIAFFRARPSSPIRWL